MACGCPLVVSDIPAHREILDERTACFVKASEPDAVAEAVKANLTPDSAAQGRMRAAQSRAAEWTIEKMARSYERLYLNLLGAA
jgi:glycosyltransferase involved in cell wall biosynthesis